MQQLVLLPPCVCLYWVVHLPPFLSVNKRQHRECSLALLVLPQFDGAGILTDNKQLHHPGDSTALWEQWSHCRARLLPPPSTHAAAAWPMSCL